MLEGFWDFGRGGGNGRVWMRRLDVKRPGQARHAMIRMSPVQWATKTDTPATGHARPF